MHCSNTTPLGSLIRIVPVLSWLGLFTLTPVLAQVANELPASEKYYYDFHPLSSLVLGGTFDPNHLDEAKLSPIRVLDTVRYEGKGSIQTNFDLHLVNSLEQLRKVVQFDAKTDVRYFRVKANARFSSLNSYSFDRNDITLVITARSEYSRRGFSKFEFTPQALDLLDNPKRFRKAYGTQVVTMERLGASVFVVLKISNVSSASRNRIQAGFGMQGKFGPVKVNVSTSFRKEVEKANRENRVDLTVVSTADTLGVAGLAGFVNSLQATGYNFDTLMARISEYMAGITPEFAKPIGFFTTSINNLGLPKPRLQDVMFSQRLETALAHVAEEYATAQSEQALAVDLVNGIHPAHVYLDGNRRIAMLALLDTLKAQQDRLVDLQEKFVKKYDKLDTDRRVRKVDEERGLRNWSKYLEVPKVSRSASFFLLENTGINLCTGGRDSLILKSKGVESVSLMLSWIVKGDTSKEDTILSSLLYVKEVLGKVGYVSFDNTSVPIEQVFGRFDVLRFEHEMLKQFMTDNRKIALPADTDNDVSLDSRYMVDLLVRNALGAETLVPLGIIYKKGARREFYQNQQSCTAVLP
jgi:prophage maintenance system killer protein/ABC-type transporter Mla MlaB component